MQRKYGALEVATTQQSGKPLSRNSILRLHWGRVDQERADYLFVYHSFQPQGEEAQGVGEVNVPVYAASA